MQLPWYDVLTHHQVDRQHFGVGVCAEGSQVVGWVDLSQVASMSDLDLAWLPGLPKIHVGSRIVGPGTAHR